MRHFDICAICIRLALFQFLSFSCSVFEASYLDLQHLIFRSREQSHAGQLIAGFRAHWFPSEPYSLGKKRVSREGLLTLSPCAWLPLWSHHRAAIELLRCNKSLELEHVPLHHTTSLELEGVAIIHNESNGVILGS